MGVIEIEKETKMCMFGVRHFQALMLFSGMVLIFCIRVCMSMAIVAMTDKSQDNTFNWSLQTQSLILSSFNWGYIILQAPGGEAVARLGGMPCMAFLVGMNSLVALLTPLCAVKGGWQMVVGCRVLQGLLQGFLNPSLHYLIGKWVPLEEKSRLGAMIYAGSSFGTALQQIGSGFIASAWGWQAIFYVNGTLGVIWTSFYLIFGSDSPQTSKIISKEERMYIQRSLGQIGGHKKYPTPWRSLFTSIPFIALMIAHAGSGYGYWTLLNSMPTYLSQVMGVNIKANGVMTAIPYISNYLMSFPLGFLSDLALKKNWLSVSACRKISNSIGIFSPATVLILLGYLAPGLTTAVGLLVLAVALNAGTLTGYNLVHLDMAPNFAGTMIGITGSFANIVSLNAPIVAGVLIQDETLASEWRKVFFVAAGVYAASNIVFLVFGSCRRQSWNEPDSDAAHGDDKGVKLDVVSQNGIHQDRVANKA